MRIAKNTVLTLTEAPSSRFMLVVDVMDGDVTLQKDGRLLLSLSLDGDGGVVARLCDEGEEIVLYAADAAKKEVILTASYARYGLYLNGVLTDEDFFFTPLDYLGAEVSAGSFMHFEAGYEYHSMPESAIVEDVAPTFEGFRPFGNDMALLSPVPAVIHDRLHVFYLDERRGGKAKRGMGANRLCALFTLNGESIHSAPIALPIDSIEEKRMVGASPITVDGRTYLYYLVDYRSGRALSCAVSDDGFSYIKTGLDIDILGENNAALDSVCALSLRGEPHLLYTKGGKAYMAKSIDLLHFEKALPLPFADGMQDLFACVTPNGVIFVGKKDGKGYYALGENASWQLLPLEVQDSRLVFFRGELLAFGTSGGALSCARLCEKNGILVIK